MTILPVLAAWCLFLPQPSTSVRPADEIAAGVALVTSIPFGTPVCAPAPAQGEDGTAQKGDQAAGRRGGEKPEDGGGTSDPVAEPLTLALVGSGLIALAFYRKRTHPGIEEGRP